MEIYSPFHKTFKESQKDLEDFGQRIDQMNVSDKTLAEYIQGYFASYREIMEKFFPTLAHFIPLYSKYPFQTYILRLGENGVIIGHRPADTPNIRILRPKDLDPPLESVNILDINKRLHLPFLTFDFRVRQYDVQEAKMMGVSDALTTALEYFWATLRSQDFVDLCQKLLRAEDVDLEIMSQTTDYGFDALGKILFQEPAGFRRFEQWAFEYKHYTASRVSASFLRQIESRLTASDLQFDILCIITSGDVTSIGNFIAVNNSKIRIWDRTVLNHLVNRHLDVLKSYFAAYPIALEKLPQWFGKPPAALAPSHFEEFKSRLDMCPTGRDHFAKYEQIGTELWHHLFFEELGKPQSQRRTLDGKQRRDVLFRNHRSTRFFQRIAEKFGADFVIIDFKNYADPVGPDVVDDVEKYANKALGRFIVVASRLGANDTVAVAQSRLFRDRDTCILVISDNQMLEMVDRKEHNERPEDVLEDLLDEFLIGF